MVLLLYCCVEKISNFILSQVKKKSLADSDQKHITCEKLFLTMAHQSPLGNSQVGISYSKVNCL